MPLTISVPDALRAAVEAATGGRQTVLYTAKGQPSYMTVIPKFNLEDVAASDSLGTGVHPAFIVNGIAKSEFFYGTFPGVIRNGELLSLPGVNPGRNVSFDTCNSNARANGAGWHMSTNAEWAALMLWCTKNGFTPRGNTNWGRSDAATYETARRIDGGAPGSTGDGATMTGSGPSSWRHDGTPLGIADLVGNVNEWQGGLRLFNGEIQIIPNNDAAIADLSAGSSAWKAISLSDGSLVDPGTAGSAKFDSLIATTTGNGGAPVLSPTIANRNGTADSNNMTDGWTTGDFNAVTLASGVTVPAILRALGLIRHADIADGDDIDLRNYGERMPMRGGYWGSAANAGLRYLNMSYPRSGLASNFGARPAFVL